METKIPTTPNGKAMYTIVRDGNGQEYKIVNFDNPEMVPDSGIKIVRAIRKSSRHAPASVTRLERDPITGIIFGIPAGLNEMTKNLRFQSIELNDNRQFDLKIRQDRMEWAVVSRAKFLQGSPYQKGKPTHVLYDVEEEAQAKVKNVNAKKLAYKTMDELSELQIIDMARNVGGINVINNSVQVIKAELYEFIDSKEPKKGPEAFNRIWEMSNREAMTVFKRCEAVGLVSFDVNAGFMWKRATALGTTEPAAIDFITKNTSLLMAMDNESRSMDSKFDEFATQEEKAKVVTAMPVSQNVDSNILRIVEEKLAKMEEKEAKLNELLNKLQPADTVKLDADIVSETNFASNADKALVDTELEELRKYAKSKGMHHAFLPASTKEKINKWLEENVKA